MRRPKHPKYISNRPLPKRLRGRVFANLTKVRTACPGMGAGEPATRVGESRLVYNPSPVEVALASTRHCYCELQFCSIEEWDAYGDCADLQEARMFRSELSELGDESQAWQVWAYERGNAALIQPSIESLFGSHARVGDKRNREHMQGAEEIER